MNTSIDREQILYNVAIGFEQFDNVNLPEFIKLFEQPIDIGL